MKRPSAISHSHFMEMALKEAKKARAKKEVPTGCVIVRQPQEDDGSPEVLARAHNQTELLKDPTAHAEMIAITQAANAMNNWRLTGTTIYVTKEPCAMCAGAIILARIPIVVFGAPDPARGGHSLFNILDHRSLNHRCEVIPSVMEDECRQLLVEFFRQRRAANTCTAKHHPSTISTTTE